MQELKKRREQLQKQISETESVINQLNRQLEQRRNSYQQLLGAITIVDELLNQSETESKEEEKPQNKEQ